jgi:hypothetical protein
LLFVKNPHTENFTTTKNCIQQQSTMENNRAEVHEWTDGAGRERELGRSLLNDVEEWVLTLVTIAMLDG